MATKDAKIVLGSGKLYCMEFVGDIPAPETLEAEENLLGLIQGGATLEYTPESYTAEDDLGLAKKTIITKEVALLKSGVMVWNGVTLTKLCATARITEDTETGIRAVKIGGVGNQDGKKYTIHFRHEDKTDGDIRVTIVGKNTAGFSLAFAKDKETVIDAEFAAEPQDDEGTLILLREDIPSAGAGI